MTLIMVRSVTDLMNTRSITGINPNEGVVMVSRDELAQLNLLAGVRPLEGTFWGPDGRAHSHKSCTWQGRTFLWLEGYFDHERTTLRPGG